MGKCRKFFFSLISLFVLSILCLGNAKAQMVDIDEVIQWNKEVKKLSDTELELIFTATIQDGWHLYATQMPENGPQATELNIDGVSGVEAVGKLQMVTKPFTHYDDSFEAELSSFTGTAVFKQKFKALGGKYSINAYIKYQVCTDGMCLPPSDYEFSESGEMPMPKKVEEPKKTDEKAVTLVNTKAEETKDKAQQTATETKATTEEDADIQSNQEAIAQDTAVVEQEKAQSEKNALWEPVIDELKNFGDKSQSQANSSLWMIFIYGLLGGLVALMTPCVWPMIPMTVSFFLKRTKDRSKAIKDAFLYGLSIILIYLLLGFGVTLTFGASALNDLATNAVFNIIFFLLLVFFAVSFFGAFELVLPASWTNKMDEKADSTTGVLSLLFMAFTLVLVSFSCTGPIIGTLLVEAATKGAMLGPAVGMFGFALALALPFALFAVFPNMLQSMPKSGGWLNSVKVVLAFLELALAFKFLSVADLAYGWGILDRETFVAIWIVIFTLLGFYLLGKLRFPHDSPREHTSVLGLFMAIISLSFAVYMVPGLWGAPLRSISAFAPPLYTQDFNLYEGEVHAQFTDYEKGMAYAKEQNKPVFVDFSGYGCVNCRKMEGNVWTDPRVKDMLEKDYVLITLMVDDKTPLPNVEEVEVNGKTRKLRTVGDKWSYLQSSKFGANAQPFYIALDHEGKPLTPSRAYDEDIEEYVKFLKGGLKNFSK